jgi:hypothetical protein
MPINSFLYPGAKVTPAYEVANSVRFNDGDTAYMHKTPSSVGDLQKFTYSVWFKRGVLTGAEQYLLEYNEAGDNDDNFRITLSSSDTLFIQDTESNTSNLDLRTNMVFRDVSAWYHLIVAVDTTQGTAANRCKVYVNGTQITSWSTETYPSQNYNTNVNVANEKLIIGRRESISTPASYFDGYMCEVVFLDGTQASNTDLGEFDEDSPNIWKPKDVSGLTFGTNGFYLDFEDSSNLGNDANGGTDLTEVNLAATDQSTDTCTNNFCTMNPLNRYQYNFTFEEGNLKVSNSSNNWHAASGTIGVNTGKWYFEAKYTGSSNLQHWYVGFGGEAQNASDATRNSVAFYNNDGGEVHTSDVSNNTATTADYGTFSQNDIIGIALDYDNEYISVYKNGSAIVTNYDYGATSYSSNLKDGKTIFPYVAHYASGDISLNFGSPAYSISSGNSDANGYGNFEYSVPSGYYALNSKNLAEFG